MRLNIKSKLVGVKSVARRKRAAVVVATLEGNVVHCQRVGPKVSNIRITVAEGTTVNAAVLEESQVIGGLSRSMDELDERAEFGKLGGGGPCVRRRKDKIAEDGQELILRL